MAVDKLVDSTQLDSDLGDIAIAIRTKGGTSAQLSFPSGFISAIEAITTGITPTGTINITQAGNTDVTNYATANVAAGSASTPATTITANPTISVSSGGLITASVSASQSVTPTVNAGYVSSGTAGTVSVSGSNTSQLTAQAAQTITPTTTNQTIASGKYLTGAQTILGDANLIAANIADGVTIFGVTGTHQGGGGGGYEDVSDEYLATLDDIDTHDMRVFLDRSTGNLVITGLVNGGPGLMMAGGLPVGDQFGTCTLGVKRYNTYNNATISGGIVTMPSMNLTSDRLVCFQLTAQGGGSIY